MDAKPQRPGRTLRVYGDENAVQAVGPQKTIHQRNKSSPALSGMLYNGPFKGVTKRTAFGDVSNVTSMGRPSKDDTAIPLKNNFKFPEKISLVQDEKSKATLQRPAQRPLSVSGLKSILSNVTNTANTAREPIMKQPLAEIQKSIQPAYQHDASLKANTKKSAVGLKDPASITTQARQLSEEALLPSIAPSAVVYRDLPPLPVYEKLQEETDSRKGVNDAKKVETEALIAKGLPKVDQELKLDDASALTADAAYVDENGGAQLYKFEDAVENFEETVELAGVRVSSNPQISTKSTHEAPAGPVESVPISAPTECIQKHMLPPVSEPEEYWDEEAGDNYEEEGYVTARSFKSRTDNTTGNATTILFPKVTQKVKKEIAAAKEVVEKSKTVEEVEDEAWDTTMVAEYGDEIFQYMRDLEIKMLPNAHYMDNQAEIQWSMRAVLMDWIVQVHHRFNLLPETLFLCVNYIDRFLSCKVVSLGKLQLVGATAIFIAAKYEEIDCPSVQEIVYMVDSGYTVDEILKAERFMLSMLQFELGWPGPMSFLRRISKADDYDLETRTLAKYFLEVTIMDERFVGSPPSFLAAGAHCLARMMLRKGSWSQSHVYYSNYTYSQLFHLVLLMVECCEDARKHHCAIFDKYTDKRYKRASQFAETEMKRGFQVLDVGSHDSPLYGNCLESALNWSQKQSLLGEAR